VIKKLFKEYVLENKYDLCMIVMLLIIGFVCGIGIYCLANANTTNELISSIKQIFDISLEGKILKSNVILNGIKINLTLILILLFFSITLIGRWFIYVTTILKGAAIGIYTCIVFSIFGFWWGLLTMLLLVVIVNLVYIPAYIYLTTTLLAFNFEIFNTKKDSTNLYCIAKMLTKAIAAFVFMFSSGIVEQLLTNVVFQIYGKL